MKRHVLLSCLLALALTGCLKARSTTTLKADGSGTYREEIVLDVVKAKGYQKALRAQMRELPPGDDPDLDDPFDKLDVEKREKALKLRKGVKVISRKQSTDDEKKTRTFDLHVAFDSLHALYESGVVEDVTVKLERSEDGKQWTLTIRHVFDGNDRDPDNDNAMEQLVRLRKAMLARYKKWWGTLEIERTLTLPTAVISTNGTKSADGKTVTWTAGFDDLPDPRKLRQVVTFANSDDLKLEPFELTANDIANAKELAEMEK